MYLKKFTGVAIAVLAAAFAILYTAGCKKAAEGEARPDLASKFVVVQQIPTGFLRSTFSMSGELRPIIQVTLSSQTSGQVMQIPVKEGDMVRAGQLLCAVDDRELRAAYAQVNAQTVANRAALEKLRRYSRPQEITKLESAVENAHVQLENAEKNLQRANELFGSGVVPLSHVETARAAMEAAKSAYVTATENLSLALEGAREEDLLSAEAAVKSAEAELERIGIQIDKSVIKAPVDGVIAKVHIEPSELVSPGMPVCDLVNLSNMQAKIGLSESDLITVNPGDTVAVRLKLAPGQPFPGVITAISPSIDKTTGTFMVEVTTPNPGGQILGGFYADFEFTRTAVKDAIIVPIDALINEGDSWHAFVVNAGRAEKRAVKPGILTPEFAQIIEGLSKGELLVVTGQRLLTDGDLVEISKTEEPKLPEENKAFAELEERAKEELKERPEIQTGLATPENGGEPNSGDEGEAGDTEGGAQGDSEKNDGDNGG